MKKAYVAGKTQDILQVRRAQHLCRTNGYTITHDWTKIVEELGGPADERHVDPAKQAELALADLRGVYGADLVIVCTHPNITGTLIEMGAAIAWNLPVWMVGQIYRHTVFYELPNVEKHTWGTLGARLWQMSDRRIEMESSPQILVPPPGELDD